MAPKIFEQCSVEGLYRLLQFLDKYVCNLSELQREVFGSHVQARKYLRLAEGLRLVRRAYASRRSELEGEGPQDVVYGLTPDKGKDWLSTLEGYDPTGFVGAQLVELLQEDEEKSKHRAYKGDRVKRWRIPYPRL